MPRTKPKVNPNRGHVAGEKLIRKNFKSRAFLLFGQIAPLDCHGEKTSIQPTKNFGSAVRHSNRPGGSQIAQADHKIAFIAPTDLWFRQIDDNFSPSRPGDL
jgi:hypothetical protein